MRFDDHEAIQLISVNSLVMQSQVRKRVSRDVISRFARTVRKRGIKMPIRVRCVGDQLIVIDGHLRLLAAKEAGLEQVPCIIEDGELSDAEVCELQLLLNCCHEDLRPVEFAKAFHRLMEETQRKASEVAEAVGVSAATASRHLALLTLSDELQAKIDAGEISASAGYKLASVEDATQREALAAAVSSRELTRDGLNKTLKAPSRGSAPKRRSAARKQRLTAALGGGRSITFSGPAIERISQLVEWLDELLAHTKTEAADGDVHAFLAGLRDRSRRSIQGSVKGG